MARWLSMKRIPSHILTGSQFFAALDGTSLAIEPLTLALAREQTSTILAIHNLIPYVRWNRDELFREQAQDGRSYTFRWRLSFVVKDAERIVAILFAYLRPPSLRHPMAAVYIHRLAVAPTHQRLGIGTMLTAFAIAAFFQAAPWLLTVSVQTNDEPANEHVMRLYEWLNLRACYRIVYPQKIDRLLEVSRSDHLAFGFAIPGERQRVVPACSPSTIRLIEDAIYGRGTEPPGVVYFGTGSKEKREQYRYLLRCYGLELMPLSTRVTLAEPQLEGSGLVAESNLVTAPLKLYSRFAALTDTYPFVVEDTMLFIEHFNADFDGSPILPGADTKRWWRALGTKGILRAMIGSTRRRATYVCQIGIAFRNTRYDYFRFSLTGAITNEEKVSEAAVKDFPYTNATFFHRIFVPAGADRTLAEMQPEEFVQFDYRRKCLEQCVQALHSAALPDQQQDLFSMPSLHPR